MGKKSTNSVIHIKIQFAWGMICKYKTNRILNRILLLIIDLNKADNQ